MGDSALTFRPILKSKDEGVVFMPPDEVLDWMLRALYAVCDVMPDVHPMEVLGCRKTARVAPARAVWAAICRRCVYVRVVREERVSIRGVTYPITGIEGIIRLCGSAPGSSFAPISYPILEMLTGKVHATYLLAVGRAEKAYPDKIEAALDILRHVGATQERFNAVEEIEPCVAM